MRVAQSERDLAMAAGRVPIWPWPPCVRNLIRGCRGVEEDVAAISAGRGGPHYKQKPSYRL